LKIGNLIQNPQLNTTTNNPTAIYNANGEELRDCRCVVKGNGHHDKTVCLLIDSNRQPQLHTATETPTPIATPPPTPTYTDGRTTPPTNLTTTPTSGVSFFGTRQKKVEAMEYPEGYKTFDPNTGEINIVMKLESMSDNAVKYTEFGKVDVRTQVNWGAVVSKAFVEYADDSIKHILVTIKPYNPS